MGKLTPLPLLDTRRALVVLGGVIAAVAGALAGMGTPQADLPALQDVPGGALETPALPGPLEGAPREKEPAREREAGGRRSRPGEEPARRQARKGPLASFQGVILGPTGPLDNVPVQLVPFLSAGRPRRAGWKILSGPQGRFCFRNLGLLPSEWALLVHAPGFGIRAFPLEGPGPLQVELSYGKWVTGKAADSQGRPVEMGRLWIGLPLTGAGKNRILWKRVGRTSREGRFVARDLPPDRPTFLLVDHPLYAPAAPVQVFPSSGGPPPTLDLSLAEGRRLRGRVLDRQGRPRAKVFLYWEEARLGGLLLRRGASTNEKGEFLLQGLPWNPPPAHLWVARPGGRARRFDLGRAARDGARGIVLRLPR